MVCVCASKETRSEKRVPILADTGRFLGYDLRDVRADFFRSARVYDLTSLIKVPTTFACITQDSTAGLRPE